MNYDILNKLRAWRDEQARIEGVEGYRVLNNSALEELARTLPQDKEALCSVKGIKDAKYRKYGKTLLGLIAELGGEGVQSEGEQAIAFFERESRSKNPGLTSGREKTEEKTGEYTAQGPLSVSQFLDSLNLELSGMAARIKGEVSSVDVRERVVYFTLKDALDESVVSCLIFRYQYDVSGVALKIGDEVIVEGAPDIYKPSGRLSLKVGVIEYAGAGELKKAYDALYQKLEKAGVFAVEGKRPIPEFSERIALITSQEGAAIGDFTMNLTRVGFRVDFYPTLVEGKKAAFEIIEAVRYFNQAPERYDVLVIIRGGGSLESLQAFNTEALVNEVAASAIPVLAGIGHERDVSLVALAADQMVSTPTATARALSRSWDEARTNLGKHTLVLHQASQEFQLITRDRLRRAEESIRQVLAEISRRTRAAEGAFREAVALFPEYCRRVAERLRADQSAWQKWIEQGVMNYGDRLKASDERLRQYDPMRVLRLGYSLVRQGTVVIRSTGSLHVGDRIDIQLGQGRVESEVISVTEE